MSTDHRLAELKPGTFNERRAHARSSCNVAVKLRQCANAMFTSGRTLDVSMGGAAIELRGPRKAKLGDRIAIAFENTKCPVTCVARMVGAEIIRIDESEGHQRIGVRFDAPQPALNVFDLQHAA